MNSSPKNFIPHWIYLKDELWPRLKTGRRLVYVKTARVWVYMWWRPNNKMRIKLKKWHELNKAEIRDNR